jgi:hypothetical protein
MFRLLLVISLFFAPLIAHAEVLPRPALLQKYVERVPQNVVAQRIGQLLDLVPAGAAKAAAKATLKKDLDDAIDGRRTQIQNRFITPLDTDETNVDDSTF